MFIATLMGKILKLKQQKGYLCHFLFQPVPYLEEQQLLVEITVKKQKSVQNK